MKIKMIVGSWLLGLFALSGATAGESGEKGGTEDINIGVGELQEGKEGSATRKLKKAVKSKEEDKAVKEYTQKDDSKPRSKKKKGNVEYEFKVEEGES
jgi:hypothetical protein